jgi:DHA3 family macrolide efflux protein-like MFS transporter
MGSMLAMFALLSLGGFRFALSTGELGGMAALFFLTLALIFPIAGAFVDGANPCRVMIVADSVRFGLMLLLGLIWDPFLVYPVLLLAGCAACFFLSAQMALLPQVVEREDLLAANAVSAQTQQATGVLAPLVAGAVIARLGERICFVLNGLSFLISALCLSRLVVRSNRAPRAIRRSRGNLGESRARHPRDLTGELRHVLGLLRRDRPLVAVMSLAMGMLLAASTIPVLGVVYVRDILRSGPRDFGSLLSSLGLGMAVGIWLVGKYAHSVPRLLLIRVSAAVIGIGLIGLTRITRVSEALMGVSLMGMAAAAFVVPAQTLVHERTPEDVRGRMSGLLWALLFATQAMAAMLIGGLTSVLTLPVLSCVLGAGLLALTGATVLYTREEKPLSPR